MHRSATRLLPVILLFLILCVVSGCFLLPLTQDDKTPSSTTAASTAASPFDTMSTTAGSPADTTAAETTDGTPDQTTAETTVTEPPQTDAPSITKEQLMAQLAAVIEPLSARQMFVYEVSTDTMLAQKGEDSRILPASVTKLLTALYALHVAPADLLITPRDELSLVSSGSSIAYIKSHHTLTVEMLIEGMMLPSGNDAAYALAAGVARYQTGNDALGGAAAVTHFMNGLNEYAKTLGCTGTHYVVPDGLCYEGHYSTNHDMVLIGKAALNNPIIAKYAKTASERVVYQSGHTNTWTNTNKFLHPDSGYYNPHVTGLKTGSLTGRYSLYISAEYEGNVYLIGVFDSVGTTRRYDEAKAALDVLGVYYAFK